MEHHLAALDLAVLAVYMLSLVGFGVYFMRRSSTTQEFMAAGRSLPGWAVGLSIFGTFVSSISFLALPGKAYAADWNPFVFSLSLPLAAWIASRWFVPFFRGTGHVSAYEHLEQRFGNWARTYAVVCYLLTQLARMGSIMYLVALPLAQLLRWDVRAIILLTGGVVTLYTLLGGIEAVIWTDVVQSVILAGGALFCAIMLPMMMPGGPAETFRIAAEQHKFSLGSFGGSLRDATFWVVLIYGLVMNLQNFGIDQNYLQRYVTAKSDREARKAVWIGALFYIPMSAVFFFIGTALFAYYAAHPGQLPAGTPPDRVFPWFIVDQLPAGVTGLLIAAILAAAMSTVDSSVNGSATLTLNDLYKRYLRPAAGERECMRVLYGATLFWGVAGTVMALAMINVRSMLDAWWSLSGIFSGGMLGLFLLGFLSRRARNAEALLGVAAGVAVIGWMTFSPGAKALAPAWRSPFHSFLVPVFGTLAILLTGFLAAALYRRPPASK